MLRSVTPVEKRSIYALSSLFGLRMFGLFMILPVFSVYAQRYLTGSTPLWMGLALGIYGVTSGLFQLILGWLSDYLGRKPMIMLGLIVFAVGSVIAGVSHSIQGVVLGRAVQGAGAIGAAAMALMADVTRDEVRTQAMAVMGMTIGFSFTLALVVGPLLIGPLGLGGLFYITAIGAILAMVMLWRFVPSPEFSPRHLDQKPHWGQLLSVLRHGQLMRLNFGIMVLHGVLVALFLVLPHFLMRIKGLTLHNQWLLYLPVLFLAFVVMIPLVVIAEKRRKIKPVMALMVATLLVGVVVIGLGQRHLWAQAIGLLLFFTSFTVLEALLPSLISKTAPIRLKGTAMGVYSSSQYLGAFVGATCAGLLWRHYSMSSVFIFMACGLLVWLLLALSMAKPKFLSTCMRSMTLASDQDPKQWAEEMMAREGVEDAVYSLAEKTAYFKIDKSKIQPQDL